MAFWLDTVLNLSNTRVYIQQRQTCVIQIHLSDSEIQRFHYDKRVTWHSALSCHQISQDLTDHWINLMGMRKFP